jgi:hypothetical protein
MTHFFYFYFLFQSLSLSLVLGVEGNPEIDRLFCEFVHLADDQGIDISLYSDPATDIGFIRNCTLLGKAGAV